MKQELTPEPPLDFQHGVRVAMGWMVGDIKESFVRVPLDLRELLDVPEMENSVIGVPWEGRVNVRFTQRARASIKGESLGGKNW